MWLLLLNNVRIKELFAFGTAQHPALIQNRQDLWLKQKYAWRKRREMSELNKCFVGCPLPAGWANITLFLKDAVKYFWSGSQLSWESLKTMGDRLGNRLSRPSPHTGGLSIQSKGNARMVHNKRVTTFANTIHHTIPYDSQIPYEEPSLRIHNTDHTFTLRAS